MPRDLRDPQEIGVGIKQTCFHTGYQASKVYDDRREMFESVVLVPEADGRYVGPLERYGDPRARHEAKS